jgi:hypothetical protein
MLSIVTVSGPTGAIQHVSRKLPTAAAEEIDAAWRRLTKLRAVVEPVRASPSYQTDNTIIKMTLSL